MYMFLNVLPWWMFSHKLFGGWETCQNEGDLKCPHHMLSQWIMKENLLSLSVEKLSQSVNTTLKSLFLFQKWLQKGCWTHKQLVFWRKWLENIRRNTYFLPCSLQNSNWRKLRLLVLAKCKYFSVLNAISLSWLRIYLVFSSHPSCCYTL